MACGGALPPATVGVGCLVKTANAPAATAPIQIVPQPGDQIDALGEALRR